MGFTTADCVGWLELELLEFEPRLTRCDFDFEYPSDTRASEHMVEIMFRTAPLVAWALFG